MQTDLIAGDTLNFETTVTAYPPSAGWTAKIRLVPRSGGSPIVITAATAATGDRYAFQVGPGVTAAWPAAVYGWALWVEKAGERYTQESGQLTVRPDPAGIAGGVDTRSAAVKALDDLRTAWAAWCASGSFTAGSYSIGGRTMQYRSIAELRAAISAAERDVEAEKRAARIAAGLGGRTRFVVRM
jgi:hypothetical protein